MRAVFRHELSGYFTTPVGYVFLTMYALLSGLVFVFINIGQGMSASMNLLFSGMQLPLMLCPPAGQYNAPTGTSARSRPASGWRR